MKLEKSCEVFVRFQHITEKTSKASHEKHWDWMYEYDWILIFKAPLSIKEQCYLNLIPKLSEIAYHSHNERAYKSVSWTPYSLSSEDFNIHYEMRKWKVEDQVRIEVEIKPSIRIRR